MRESGMACWPVRRAGPFGGDPSKEVARWQERNSGWVDSTRSTGRAHVMTAHGRQPGDGVRRMKPGFPNALALGPGDAATPTMAAARHSSAGALTATSAPASMQNLQKPGRGDDALPSVVLGLGVDAVHGTLNSSTNESFLSASGRSAGRPVTVAGRAEPVGGGYSRFASAGTPTSTQPLRPAGSQSSVLSQRDRGHPRFAPLRPPGQRPRLGPVSHRHEPSLPDDRPIDFTNS